MKQNHRQGKDRRGEQRAKIPTVGSLKKERDATIKDIVFNGGKHGACTKWFNNDEYCNEFCVKEHHKKSFCLKANNLQKKVAEIINEYDAKILTFENKRQFNGLY